MVMLLRPHDAPLGVLSLATIAEKTTQTPAHHICDEEDSSGPDDQFHVFERGVEQYSNRSPNERDEGRQQEQAKGPPLGEPLKPIRAEVFKAERAGPPQICRCYR